MRGAARSTLSLADPPRFKKAIEAAIADDSQADLTFIMLDYMSYSARLARS